MGFWARGTHLWGQYSHTDIDLCAVLPWLVGSLQYASAWCLRIWGSAGGPGWLCVSSLYLNQSHCSFELYNSACVLLCHCLSSNLISFWIWNIEGSFLDHFSSSFLADLIEIFSEQTSFFFKQYTVGCFLLSNAPQDCLLVTHANICCFSPKWELARGPKQAGNYRWTWLVKCPQQLKNV